MDIGLTFLRCGLIWLTGCGVLLLAILFAVAAMTRRSNARVFLIVFCVLVFGAISWYGFPRYVSTVHQRKFMPEGKVEIYNLGLTTVFAHVVQVSDSEFEKFVLRHRLEPRAESDGLQQITRTDRRRLGFADVDSLFTSKGKSLRVYRKDDSVFVAYNSL